MKQATFQAGLFDELEPIYPDTDVTAGKETDTLAGANGSYAGVHIALSGLTPGIPVTFEVNGPHRAYKLFELLPVPVEVNCGAVQRSEYLKNDHNENVIRRAPFMVYEALEPIFNIVRPQYETAAFAFRTPIEYCREKDTQEWTITIRHNGAEKSFAIRVERYPAVIPPAGKDTYQFVNWFSFSDIALSHHTEVGSPRYMELLEKYLRAAVYTRQNILAVPCNSLFALDEQGNPVLRRELFFALIALAKKVGITLFQGGALCSRALSQADDDDFYHSLDHKNFTSPEQIGEEFKKRAFEQFDYGSNAVFSPSGALISTETGKAHLRSALAQLFAAVREAGINADWQQSCLDEPNDALCDTYRTISAITREEMTGVQILEPVLPTEKVIGAVDVWCPSLHIYEQNRAFFEQRYEAGDRLYVYACLTPAGNYCNRLLDMERLRVVWLAWAPVLYPHVEGFLHWGMNYTCGNDPFHRQAAMFSEQVLEYHPKYANFLPAGDECILYPGYNGPLTSTRSEAHRIGFEDLCLLQKLRERDPERAEELVRKVFRGYQDYSKSVAEYRKAKRELLELSL